MQDSHWNSTNNPMPNQQTMQLQSDPRQASHSQMLSLPAEVMVPPTFITLIDVLKEEIKGYLCKFCLCHHKWFVLLKLMVKKKTKWLFL